MNDQQKTINDLQAEIAILRVVTSCLLAQAVGKTTIKQEVERILPLLVASQPNLDASLRKHAGMYLSSLGS